jgi:hypothetical protein
MGKQLCKCFVNWDSSYIMRGKNPWSMQQGVLVP